MWSAAYNVRAGPSEQGQGDEMGADRGSAVVRGARRVGALVVVLALAGVAAGCGGGDESATSTTAATATSAASVDEVAGWPTWVLTGPDRIEVPPPPAEGSPEREAELREVEDLATRRTPEVMARVARWNGPVATEPWTVVNNEYIASRAKDPPMSSRNLAYTHVAMYDALVAAYHWKARYERPAPEGAEPLVDAGDVPSYPSEHAAIAAAASRVLAHLYPDKPALRLEEMADEAAQSRVEAGVNTRSDVDAGLALGLAVADAVIAKADADGSDVVWDGRRPPGIGRGPQYWEPPPGTVSPPIQPLAGTWKTWVLTSGSQLRSMSPPPPPFGSEGFRKSVDSLLAITGSLTDEQRRIAKFWEGAEGTPLPAGILNQVVLEDVRKLRLGVPETARVFALVNIAMADAGGGVWDAKYVYWYPRPEPAISDAGIVPGWTPPLPTPRFPAYPSGSAGYAGAVEGVMSALFPSDAARFRARAEEQALSRQMAGIHWDFDSVSLDLGRKVAEMVVERQGL
jgi:hypothetical protein